MGVGGYMKTEFDPGAMDLAAEKAKDVLESLDQVSVDLIAQWFADNYMAAGHKRLGRILVAWSKNHKG
mgnify:CR=1 FL=1